MTVPYLFAPLSGDVPAAYLDANFAACLTAGGQPPGSMLGNAGPSVGTAVPLTPTQIYNIIKPVMPWEVNAFMGGLQGGGYWFILRYQPSTNLFLMTGSCFASSNAPATGQTVFNILDNGGSIGSVVFPAGGTTGQVVINASPYSFARGHVLAIQGPGSPDPGLADMNITIGGVRN